MDKSTEISRPKRILLEARALAKRLQNVHTTHMDRRLTVQKRLEQQLLATAGREQHHRDTVQIPRRSCSSTSLRVRGSTEDGVEQEDLAQRLANAFSDAQAGMHRILEEQHVDDFVDYRLSKQAAKAKASNNRQEHLKFMSFSLGVARVVPPSGMFSHAPVSLEMTPPHGDCVIEFDAIHVLPDGWQRRLNPEPTRYQICRYHRPLSLEQAGEWNVRVRLRHLASAHVSAWQSFKYEIGHGVNGDDYVAVVRCIVRTELNQMSNTFNLSSHAPFERAMEAALGIPSLIAKVTNVFFVWPHVNIHYAMHRPGWGDAKELSHPMESVLHKLREPQLIPSLAQSLRKDGVEIRPGMTSLLGGDVRSLLVLQGSGIFGSNQTQHVDDVGHRLGIEGATKPPSYELLSRADYARFRALFHQPGRVHTRMPFANEAHLLERFFRLPTPLFSDVLKYL